MRTTHPLPEALRAAYPGIELRLHAEPRPFPGLRVGQVWGLRDEEETLTVALITGWRVLPSYEVGVERVIRWRAPEWCIDGVWWQESELSELCQTSFLLADAVCPHLAPWAPAADAKALPFPDRPEDT